MSPTDRRPPIVCKVGGSLLDAGRAPALVRVLDRVTPGLDVVLVSGGGRAADRLRARHAKGEISEEKAHWAAVGILDVTALRLAGGCGRDLTVTASLPPPEPGLAVLPPRALLRSEDPLPHSWAVTSDSIAAWCGLRLGASDVLLLKARDGVRRPTEEPGPRTPVSRASRAGFVDEHLPSLLAGTKLRVWTLNGRHPGRLLRWLTGDRAAATRLVPGRASPGG